MAAPIGNQFWKIRSKHGREKLFETPKLLLEAAYEYFEWCDENPFIAKKNISTDKGFSEEEKPTERPYSKSGFYIYIGCSEAWLREFKKVADKDFMRVIEEIENTIETQQWTGATIGVYNSNIIARTLGLMEKSDITSGGEKIQRNVIKWGDREIEI